MSLWSLFIQGGPLMWPILLCSSIALALIVLKARGFRRLSAGSDIILEAVLEKMRHNRIKEALEICERSSTPVSRVLKAGILKYDRARQEVKEAMDNAAHYEIPALEEHLPLLVTIAHASPLLGLLGTVTGFVCFFYSISSRTEALLPVYSAELSWGIWQSLITTMAGLAVAIPSFIAYNYFSARVNNYILQMEKAADGLLNYLSE